MEDDIPKLNNIHGVIITQNHITCHELTSYGAQFLGEASLRGCGPTYGDEVACMTHGKDRRGAYME